MSTRPKKVLFLLSATGGGHRASAETIGEAIEHLHPGKYTFVIEDLWKNHMPWPICCIPNTYGRMTAGGEGQQQLYKTARHIASTTHQGQLLIVAGSNKKLEKQLKGTNGNIPTKIFGFVEKPLRIPT